MKKITIILVALIGLSHCVQGQIIYQTWPRGSSPQIISSGGPSNGLGDHIKLAGTERIINSIDVDLFATSPSSVSTTISWIDWETSS